MSTTLAPTPPTRTHAQLVAAVDYRDSDHSYRLRTDCPPCETTGRVAGSRDGTTKTCPKCKGAGYTTTRIPSVTTILGELAKPMLVQWAADQAADAVFDLFTPAVGDVLTADMVDEAHAAAKVAHRQKKDEAAATGTTVHDWIEQWHGDVLGAPLPEGDATAPWAAFVAWWQTAGYEVVGTERIVMDAKARFVGRFDLLLRDSRGGLWIADIKTSNGVYPEHVLQCAAYATALRQEIGESMAGTIVIHLHKDGRPVHTVVRTPREYRSDFRVFAALLGINAHKKKIGPVLRQLSQSSKAAAEAMALPATPSDDFPF